MSSEYDLIVIGAGPGGYIAAERAGEAGQKVLLVEKEEMGGECTNWGCIPTKSLLAGAKQFVHAKESERFGVTVSGAKYDLKTAMAWKQETIETLRAGIAFLMKKNKVEVLKGSAVLNPNRSVNVNGGVYRAKNIIIATGSSAAVPPIPGADGKNVVTNRGILSIEALPKKLAVIGGGVIGVEFASYFSAVGVQVTVVEMMDEILPLMDGEFAKAMRKAVKGIEFVTSAKVTKITGKGVEYEKGGKTETAEADLILMSVGRRPNLEGFTEAGLDISRSGIKVDEKMRTNLPGVFAVGDVTGTSLLAHSASRMGEVAVNTILGKEDRMRYHAIPWAVYTLPEAAGCGLTEKEAAEKGIPVKTATVQMRANGRFLAEHGKREPGMCKVLVHAEKRSLLGVHIMGGVASEIIPVASAMIEAELRADEIKEIIFPHPAVAEVIRDAVWEIE
ncbi:dihydrolipoyl dehydrogenase [Marispirochaeta sp.]|uniref:dihydrolipoyl dehydrogenase n=1 Tax=Marispirochaeta sp. TaxID=2038653 RepID=UPI0029C8E484|nr:dihydrolipoyl dehydrogenase [Marispirochaeta sp.]